MDDASHAPPVRQHADQLPRKQRIAADVIGQERDAEPGGGGVELFADGGQVQI